MKMYQVYVCEYCGKEYKSHKDAELCEATHIGLSVSEKHTWDALKSAAEYFGRVVSKTNNERTRATYDDAIKKLVSFEQSHHLL